MRDFPSDPLAAVTHPDPAPYYQQLQATRPLYFDRALQLWVASSASVVEAVLAHPACRVRPTLQPLPAALRGTPLAGVFGRLIRMNDGEYHAQLKPALAAALAVLPPLSVDDCCAQVLATMPARLDGAALDDWLFAAPLQIMARLLGLPPDADRLALMRDFVAALSPLATAADIARGSAAVTPLLAQFAALPAAASPLYAALASRITPPASLHANALGLLLQTWDASAGLIGNVLYRLAVDAGLREVLRQQPAWLDDGIAESQRLDAAIHNTRRYLAADADIAGHALRAGDGVLLLLAAANLDPARHPQPLRFELQRERQELGFGAATHRCPGSSLALSIARQFVQQCLRRAPDWPALARSHRFRASLNARIRLFADAAAAGSTP
ncbi:cytochrome P450 [Vogesella indigofera]|uniref:cytochrome P450 n=1 Tax=Vogesella indigofera TaxID=45465 RepID=UPI00234E4703|nr:cytochrome P450 [Vogesella indigofera]MDC7697341.1 cytochrome P450 [Vogesella indigofera]